MCADLQKQNESMQASLDQYKQLNIDLEKRNALVKASRDRHKQFSLELEASLDDCKKLNIDLEKRNASIKASRDRHRQISLDMERQNEKCKVSFDLYKRHIQQKYENGRSDVSQLKEELAQLKDANKTAVKELQQSKDKCYDSKRKIKLLKNTINELQLEIEELNASIDALQSELSAKNHQHTADMAKSTETINNNRKELLFCRNKLRTTTAQLKKMEDATRQSERESTQTTIDKSVSNGENQAARARKRKATETNSTDEPISSRTRTKVRKILTNN